MKKKQNMIHYGFGKDYLSSWGIKEALREIYQNFFDYGPYTETVIENDNLVEVTISNLWQPETLDFLRIGNSQKSAQAIGKHGEGMKMAFLILLREQLFSRITTPLQSVVPSFYSDDQIGECFCLIYTDNTEMNDGFSIEFHCPKDIFNEFKFNLITPDDVIFDDGYWGQIVDKPKGNIYSGSLFVTYSQNISKAYNIKPQFLPLDRDRSVPRSFDLNYAASKINEAQGKFEVEDLSMSDTSFVQRIPEEMKEKFTPVIVGNSLEFVVTDNQGNDQIVSNYHVKETLTRDSFFAAAIKKLKLFVAKQLGLYDLLIDFKNKHVHSTEALMDFELILEKVDVNHKPAAQTQVVDDLPF